MLNLMKGMDAANVPSEDEGAEEAEEGAPEGGAPKGKLRKKRSKK